MGQKQHTAKVDGNSTHATHSLYSEMDCRDFEEAQVHSARTKQHMSGFQQPGPHGVPFDLTSSEPDVGQAAAACGMPTALQRGTARRHMQ